MINVTIKNIKFINAKVNGDSGSAIYWSNSYGCSVSGCSFVNCSGDYGGAIMWSGSFEGSVSGCSFVNCSGDYGGGIRRYYSHGDSVSGCSFVNCSALEGGGAIYWDDSDNGIISDCVFINVAAPEGKAIFIDSVSASLDRNWFGNTAENYKSSPNEYINGASTDNWLFLNATVKSRINFNCTNCRHHLQVIFIHPQYRHN